MRSKSRFLRSDCLLTMRLRSNSDRSRFCAVAISGNRDILKITPSKGERGYVDRIRCIGCCFSGRKCSAGCCRKRWKMAALCEPRFHCADTLRVLSAEFQLGGKRGLVRSDGCGTHNVRNVVDPDWGFHRCQQHFSVYPNEVKRNGPVRNEQVRFAVMLPSGKSLQILFQPEAACHVCGQDSQHNNVLENVNVMHGYPSCVLS